MLLDDGDPLAVGRANGPAGRLEFVVVAGPLGHGGSVLAVAAGSLVRAAGFASALLFPLALVGAQVALPGRVADLETDDLAVVGKLDLRRRAAGRPG